MIRVLVVDDSAIVRKVLTKELSKYADVEVVGDAIDPYVARDKIVKLRPDVLTLDLEMPRMNGLDFLEKLMQHQPMPVVVVSSMAPENSENALRALTLGAVDVISKPGSTYSTPDVSRRLIHAVRAASVARVKQLSVQEAPPTPVATPPDFRLRTTHRVVAIGASTGGTRAIETVLAAMPITAPGTVVVQHMPEHFTASFAQRLNQVCQMEVREARDGDPVVPGVALIAPGDRHMLLRQSGARYLVKTNDRPPVHHQRPSVDVLFQSAAQSAGRNAVAALLTGMGADGAKGLLALRNAGARTMAQDEKTCIVFGMPKEAIELDAAEEIVPLPRMAKAILDAAAAPGP